MRAIRPATLTELAAMRERLERDAQKLGPFGDPAERVKLRDAALHVATQVRARRSLIVKELAEADRLLASVSSPWRVAGSSVHSSVWALLSRTNGRIWARALSRAALDLLGLKRAQVFTALAYFEKQGLVRVHAQPSTYTIDGVIPSWVEVLAMTGGDGVAPPEDRHVHANGREAPRPKSMRKAAKARRAA